ncbi:hypothetical protein NC652_000799 [Populus alba x Populus x berolinensis]|nr:hypothetical protein NC652_000799 [Populus alba x Populus x berolinensis]
MMGINCVADYSSAIFNSYRRHYSLHDNQSKYCRKLLCQLAIMVLQGGWLTKFPSISCC